MTLEELTKEMEDLRAEQVISDIQFFQQEIKHLAWVIQQYPKLPKEKRDRHTEGYVSTMKFRNELILQLNEMLKEYETTKEAEEFFSKAK